MIAIFYAFDNLRLDKKYQQQDKEVKTNDRNISREHTDNQY
jgi:hypothetical protein